MRTLAAIVATAAITFSGAGIAAAADEETEKPPTATIETGDSPREVGTAPESPGIIEPVAAPESASDPIENGAEPESASEPRPDPEAATADELIEATAPDEEE
ncbi:hypothetical protein ACFWXB_11610 [Tsukamurella tyrosinosolvens]|uniref:hypothetical protein n=1 Tax=Tsukamurella tyrosinosolvens TaxID=57704 RepID=UPI002DD42A0B|nr:hypothetical protein [Tsukamurella tyrosinosolvens]MEC4612467.1 hypothetical protein [Tsukamurella tyrosinosolvens]